MKKVGRNDPCPCGSGLKFKKCHMGKEDELTSDSMGEISFEASTMITKLPPVHYGRSGEMVRALDVEKLTGAVNGIKFIDLKAYSQLGLLDRDESSRKKGGEGGIVVNLLKTRKSDPDNVYVAISPEISDSVLVHQLAHVLDYLGGSKLMTSMAKPLSFDLGIPVEHLEHPHEYGYWLVYLRDRFKVQLDADDAIIAYLYENRMLVRGEYIETQNRLALKSKSDRILAFMSEKSVEINEMIRELPGYIGSRVKKD